MAELVPSATRLDLAGMATEYDVRDRRPLGARALRRCRTVLLGLLLVALLVAGWWGGTDRVLQVLSLAAVTTVVTRASEHPRLRARTRLAPEEIEVKGGGLGRGDRYAWWFVREITCRPGRTVPGRAVLGDGRRLRLHGMPAADVVLLARALERARGGAGG